MIHNEINSKQDICFRIVALIIGYNRMQQIAEVKKYYASDIHEGIYL